MCKFEKIVVDVKVFMMRFGRTGVDRGENTFLHR